MTHPQIWRPYIVAAIGVFVAAFVGYSAAVSTMNARVAVLEAEKDDLRTTVRELQQDVKVVLRKCP